MKKHYTIIQISVVTLFAMKRCFTMLGRYVLFLHFGSTNESYEFLAKRWRLDNANLYCLLSVLFCSFCVLCFTKQYIKLIINLPNNNIYILKLIFKTMKISLKQENVCIKLLNFHSSCIFTIFCSMTCKGAKLNCRNFFFFFWKSKYDWRHDHELRKCILVKKKRRKMSVFIITVMEMHKYAKVYQQW